MRAPKPPRIESRGGDAALASKRVCEAEGKLATVTGADKIRAHAYNIEGED